MSFDPLPEADEREWLLDALAELIAARGWERFVTAPILAPSPAYFPDPFAPDARGVYVIAQRLLRYAGIGDLVATVVTADLSESREGTAAFFRKIEGDECEFGVDSAHLGDPDVLVGAMCHEVAHAFRDRHGIALRDPYEDEPLTDLTSVYLGFGILTANITARYEASGNHEYTAWKHSSFGYLSPQAVCFLLAAQAVARNVRAGTIASDLQANQAAHFRASYKALGSAADLRQRLGLPDPALWPEPADLDELVAPLPDSLEDLPLVVESAAPEAAHVVLRVRGNRSSGGMAIGLLVGFTAGLFFALAGHPRGLVASTGVGTLIGLLAGYSWPEDRCSRCRSLLPRTVSVCRWCAGTVADPRLT